MARLFTRRKIIFSALATVLTCSSVLLVGLLAIRLGYLDRWLVARLEAKLGEYGVRFTAESVQSKLRGVRVEMHGLKFYAADARDPFATVERVEIAATLRDLLGFGGPTEIDLRECTIDGLRARYEIDADGRSNLAGLHPSSNLNQRFILRYQAASFTVRQAEILYLDRLHKLDGTARQLTASLAPAANERMRLVASARAGDFICDGRHAKEISFDLDALVNGAGARIEALKIEAPPLAAELQGELKDWRTFAYQFDARAELRLHDLGGLFAPALKLGGAAEFEGQIEGAGIEYRAHGKLRGERILARHVRLDGLTLSASGQGRGLDAKARTELAVRLLETSGFRLNRLSAIGEFVDGDADFSWAGLLRADGFAGENAQGEGLRVERARLTGPYNNPARSRLSGGLRLSSLITADVPIGDLSGEMTATLDRIEVANFTGKIFGGEAKGSAKLQLGGGGESELIADLSALDLDQGIAVLAGRRFPLRGAAEGALNLRWPGRNFRDAEGAVNLRFAGDTLTNESGTMALAVNGALNLVAAAHAWRLDNTVIRTGASELRASGTLGWDRTGVLDVNLVSGEAAELQRLVVEYSTAVEGELSRRLTAALGKYDIQLGRRLRFDGRVAGALEDPQIDGRFALDALSIRHEEIGGVTGNLTYSRQVAQVDGGQLHQGAGGQADFTFNYPFMDENGASLRAQLQGVEVGSFLHLFADVSLTGRATGKADLAGLPEAMRGAADLSLAGAKYDGRPIDEARGRLTLNGTRINADELQLRIGHGVIAGTGWLDTRTRGYRLDLRGEIAEVSELIDAGRDLPFAVTGRAEVVIEAESEKFERGTNANRFFDRLVATVKSDNLSFNGQPLGTAQLSIKGSDSQAQVDVRADLIGQQYTAAGAVDFRPPAAPVKAIMKFGDVALAPIFDLVTDQRFSTAGTVAGEIRLDGNLFSQEDPARIEANLSKLTFDSKEAPFAAQAPVVLKLQGQQLDLGRIKFSGPETNLEIAGTISLGGTKRLGLTANGDVNLRVIQNFVKDISADGVVRVQIAASGTPSAPRLSGSATLDNGALRSRTFPLALNNANGRLLFTADQAQIASLVADIGGGRVNLTGGAALAGFVPDRWRLQARASGVRVDYPRDVRTSVDGDFTLQGNRRLQVLSGTANVRRSEYQAETDLFDFVERFMTEFSGGLGDLTIGGGVPPTQLDLRVVANDSLVISNKSLDVVASTDLRLIGSLEDPQIKGRLTISRGLIDDLFRERYRITSGAIEFSGISERSPRLNLEAETVISGYQLSVLIAGTFDNLRITPRSEPPLPQVDVITLMTTGQLPRDGLTADSPTQALAQTQAQNLSTLLAQPLSSRIGSNVTGRLFGLNRFSIDPLVTGRGTDPTARITVGRRLTKDLSVTYSTNLASNQDQVLLIEYRASDRLSFVASRAQDGAFGLDVRLRKRF